MVKPYLNSLQIFRGYAALAVVVYHSSQYTSQLVSPLPIVWENFFKLGMYGVDFFFVLSGFIIMNAHLNDPKNYTSIKNYLYKRVTRIYPPYLPVSITLISLYFLMPGLSSADREISILSSIFLLPSNEPPALSVAWTLIHEIIFYSIFLSYFLGERLFFSILVFWTLLIFMASPIYQTAGWEHYFLSYYNLDFMIGVISVLILNRWGNKISSRYCLIFGTVIFLLILCLIYFNQPLGNSLTLSIPLAVMILGVVINEREHTRSFSSLLALIGNASFAIYLIHVPLLSITQRIAGLLDLIWPLAILFGFCLSILAGIAYHKWFEIPVIHKFRILRR